MNLYKKSGSRYWHFAIVTGTGSDRGQKVVNTQATDQRVAHEILHRTQLLVESIEGGMGLSPTLRNWLTTMHPKLRKRLERLGLIEAADAASVQTIAKHIDDYLAACRFQGMGEAYGRIKKSQLAAFVDHGKARSLADLTADRVSAFLGSLKDRGLSNRTLNQHRSTLIAFANWCIKQGRNDRHNLGTQVPRLNEEVGKRRSRRAATKEEITGLLDAASDHRRFVYLAALLTGLRRGELGQIQWRDIDLTQRTMTVRAEVAKTSKPSIQPLHADMLKLLVARAAGRQPDDLVFAPVPRIETFKRDLKRAGISFKDENDRQLDFHALRATFATMLLREAVPVSIARQLTRHASAKTLEKHYDRLGLADAAEAIKRLPGLDGPKP